MTSGRLIGHEVFHVAVIIEELLGTQPLESLTDDVGIVAAIQQLALQFQGCVVAPGQRIERSRPGSLRIEGFERSAGQTLRLFGVAASVHRRLLGNQFGANLGFDVPRDFRVLLQENTHVVLALADALALVAVPGAGFLH